MIVVSDASPLIALATIGELGLLRRLYDEIVVPEAVYREVASTRPSAPGAAEFRAASWVRTHAVQNRLLVNALSLQLDVGEAEAIALAVELNAELLLIDERRGRTAATRLGRRVVGVLGALVEAKQRKFVLEVRPLLDRLAVDAGFRISPELRARVMETAGE
ncbi:MAG: DUF3368 domain-containing protein [Gemmatimonadetes bacterium]|nr:DUF3368 domain-containing protein [Gemmatimonadota bacterium]